MRKILIALALLAATPVYAKGSIQLEEPPLGCLKISDAEKLTELASDRADFMKFVQQALGTGRCVSSPDKGIACRERPLDSYSYARQQGGTECYWAMLSGRDSAKFGPTF